MIGILNYTEKSPNLSPNWGIFLLARNYVVRLRTRLAFRNSRAIAILWGVFTVCSAILNIVVFISPQWVGDTELSKGPGHFGLWRFCTVLSSSSDGSSQARPKFGSEWLPAITRTDKPPIETSSVSPDRSHSEIQYHTFPFQN